MPEVRLLGRLRAPAGGARLRLDGGDVRAVLAALAGRDGGLAALLYADPARPAGGLHRDLRVLVNGRSIDFLAGPDTPLAADDIVTVYLHGGRGYPGG